MCGDDNGNDDSSRDRRDETAMARQGKDCSRVSATDVMFKTRVWSWMKEWISGDGGGGNNDIDAERMEGRYKATGVRPSSWRAVASGAGGTTTCPPHAESG